VDTEAHACAQKLYWSCTIYGNLEVDVCVICALYQKLLLCILKCNLNLGASVSSDDFVGALSKEPCSMTKLKKRTFWVRKFFLIPDLWSIFILLELQWVVLISTSIVTSFEVFCLDLGHELRAYTMSHSTRHFS
jgi:hypothetical protein